MRTIVWRWLTALLAATSIALFLQGLALSFPDLERIAASVSTSLSVTAFVWAVTQLDEKRLAKTLWKIFLGAPLLVSSGLAAWAVFCPVVWIECSATGDVMLTEVTASSDDVERASWPPIEGRCRAAGEVVVNRLPWSWLPAIRVETVDHSQYAELVARPLQPNSVHFRSDFKLPFHVLVSLDDDSAAALLGDSNLALNNPTSCTATAHCFEIEGNQLPLGPNGIVLGALRADTSLLDQRPKMNGRNTARPIAASLEGPVRTEHTLTARLLRRTEAGYKVCHEYSFPVTEENRLWRVSDTTCPP